MIFIPVMEHAPTLTLCLTESHQLKKNIGQKNLWNFWFDKSLKIVMGPPFSVVYNNEQIFHGPTGPI